MSDGKVLHVTNETFANDVLGSQKPDLVDFWASWCGPCKIVGPIMDRLAEKFEGKTTIAKINIDEQSKLASTFKIMSIPTIMLFKNGKVVEKIMGARPQEEFEKMITNHA